MRYLAYARISRDPDNSSEAIARQTADNTRLAEQLGWSPLEHLIDRNRSAWKKGGSRPAFRELHEAIDAGTCAGIIIWNIDRLLRRTDDLEELIAAVERNPVPIHAASGEIDLSTPEGRFQARILVAVSQKESDDKSRRIRRALEGKPNSQRPYGQTAAERKVIKWAANRIIAGDTWRAVCNQLNAKNTPTAKYAQAWIPASIRLILRADHTRSILGDTRYVELQVAIESRRRGRPRQDPRSPSPGYPLTRLLHCGLCGHTMYGARTSAGVARYKCGGNGGCGRVGISPASAVEEAVVRRLSEELDGGMHVAKVARPEDISSSHADRLQEVQDSYYLRREFDRPTYERLVGEITRDMKLHSASIEATLDSIVPIGKHFIEDYLSRTPVGQRQLLSRLITRIDCAPAVRGRPFDPTRLTIHTAVAQG